MITGFLHLHKALAYLMFLVALADVILALTAARSDPRAANVLRWAHTLGLLMAGRVSLVVGLTLWVQLPYGVGTPWIWLSLLLWGPIEVAAKRLVAPELKAVADGGTASGRLLGGVGIELLCVVLIFGLMSVRP